MKKGPLFEAQVVQCLIDAGHPYAERRLMGGSRDRGDVAGISGVVIEIKNSPNYVNELSKWVDEALQESANAGGVNASLWPPAAVWHKRRGKGDPKDCYVTMTGRHYLWLLAAYTQLIEDRKEA